MAVTQLRTSQLGDQSVGRSKLKADFLEGQDLNLSNGANNATITGLKAGVNANDAVIKQQLDDVVASFSGALLLKGELDASNIGTTLDDAGKGHYFIVTTAGTLFSTNPITVHVGDHLICKEDVVGTPDDGAKWFKQDNSESSDILRDGDVFAGLTSTDDAKVLAASQGKILQDQVTALQNAQYIPVFGEKPVVTNGSAILGALINAPLAGSVRVYLNGVRQEEGSGNDYTISGSVITFTFPLSSLDKVLVDYHR